MDTELKQQFDEIGIEPSADVLHRSLELCITHNINDAVEFVEMWQAFSVSHLHGDEPTVNSLNEFERKVLLQNKHTTSNKRKHNYSPASTKTTTPKTAATTAAAVDENPLAVYGITGRMDDVADNVVVLGDYINDVDSVAAAVAAIGDHDMLDSYICHTPKAKGTFPRTPAHRRGDGLFSPACYSPINGTPRSCGTPRTGSGKIVITFGNPTIIKNAQWGTQQSVKINVKPLLLHNGEPLSATKTKYMFYTLRELTDIIEDRIFNIGKKLCEKVFCPDGDGNADADYDLSQVDANTADVTKTIGTVASQDGGPLSDSTAILIGTDEMRCRTVNLNFSHAKSFGIFPGQIAIFSGRNPKGDTFMVEEIFSERQIEQPMPPKIADQLSFVIASGPYTNYDDLVYEPLNDLMTYLKDNKPDVLILTGPFMDVDHQEVNETLAETFDTFFEKMIAGIVEILGTCITILIVASHRDAMADPVYPTLPLNVKKNYPNVHFLSDPTMIDLNGVIIGATSTDIMDHIVSNELTINGGDKVKRIVNHLLHQGSFYPLNPPVEDKMCFDHKLADKYANISQIPNILILPSRQRCFIRQVHGCLAINPGQSADPQGGTFVRLLIQPPSPKDEDNLMRYVGCQVRRI